MKAIPLVIALLAAFAFAFPVASTARSVATTRIAEKSCRDRPEQSSFLTIVALHIYNMPIGSRDADRAKGPIWDLCFAARPGDGKTMVIAGHDVTPVPGYGSHGPFYNLITIKPGYLAKIKWHGVWRTYRFVKDPFARPQSENVVVNQDVEAVWFYSCWPRYTRNDYLYEKAVLVTSKK